MHSMRLLLECLLVCEKSCLYWRQPPARAACALVPFSPALPFVNGCWPCPCGQQEADDMKRKATDEGLGSLFGADGAEAPGFADQFHMAFEHQNRSLMAQLERVGVELIDLSVQDW